MSKFIRIFLMCCVAAGSGPVGAYADPDKVIFNSELVWRSDDLGDYRIPADLSGTYESKDIILTAGDIKSITASWTCKGRVTMEVSADNGFIYAAVVPGVAVTSESFNVGRNLKWRAVLSEGSSLSEVRIWYTDTSGTVVSFGNSRLSGFKFRKRIKVRREQASEDLFNYQVKLSVGETENVQGADVICDGGILAEFKDLRFTYLDGRTIIPHFIEKIKGDRPCRTAEVFIKLTQIPAQGVDIYLYYGSAAAQDLSNGGAVFDFYDNFSEGVLDKEKWVMYKRSDASLSFSDSGVVLDNTALLSRNFEFSDGILEFSAQSKSGGEIMAIARGQDVEANQEDFSHIVYSSEFVGAQHCIAVGDIVKANVPNQIMVDTPYQYKVIASGNSMTFERYSRGIEEREAAVTYQELKSPKSGYIGLKAEGSGRGKSITEYKWVRVRKYFYPEPQVSQYEKEFVQETVNPAEFNNILVAENGNIALIDKSKEGTFTTEVINSLFNVSVISSICELTQPLDEKVKVDVSADGAKTFKTGCVNGQYYYAQRGAFTAGNKLLSRITISAQGREDNAEVESLTLEYLEGKVHLLSPNGGEVFSAGNNVEIKWSALAFDEDYLMKLEYSADNGNTYHLISAAVKSTGSFLWKTPDVSSSQALVRISDAQTSEVFDKSDAPFIIEEAGAGAGSVMVNLQDWSQEEPAALSQEELLKIDREIKKSSAEDLGGQKQAQRKIEDGVYELLVKVSEKYFRADDENRKITYAKGEIVSIQPQGYQWGIAEQQNFMIIPVQLSAQEAERIYAAREAVTSDSGQPAPGEEVRVDLGKLRFTDKSFKQVREELKGKVFSIDIIGFTAVK